MPKRSIVALCLPPLVLLCACSPRNFLTRRLAADLIASSDAFKASQLFWLRTGVISNKDYLSPDYLVLQHRGWISGTKHACPVGLAPPPCWDVMLTPSGVDTFQEQRFTQTSCNTNPPPAFATTTTDGVSWTAPSAAARLWMTR
jgi:hypothetical protein